MESRIEARPPSLVATEQVTYGSDLFFFQAEDGIRDPLWSRGLGDVYKRQTLHYAQLFLIFPNLFVSIPFAGHAMETRMRDFMTML